MKYNENATCEKCGHTVIQSLFIEPHPKYIGGSYCGETPAVIRRTCTRCQYQWNEEPLK